MAKILVLEWLEENSLRAFPLTTNCNKEANTGFVVPNSLFLDLSFTYSSSQADVSLLSIIRAGNNLTFTFTGAKEFTCNRTSNTPLYLHVGTDLLVLGEGIMDIPEGTHTFSDTFIEPLLVTEYFGEWAGVESATFNDSVSLTGDINLFEGLQFSVNRLTDNTLGLGVNNYYGDPVGCESYGTTTPDCDSIVSNLNNVGPDGSGVLTIRNGGGMVVYDDPQNHRIYLGFSFSSPDDICKPIITPPIL